MSCPKRFHFETSLPNYHDYEEEYNFRLSITNLIYIPALYIRDNVDMDSFLHAYHSHLIYSCMARSISWPHCTPDILYTICSIREDLFRSRQ